MRDGVRLHTVILTPRQAVAPLPMLMLRTPYGVNDYVSYFARRPTTAWVAGYILVLQDIRGRFGSEGAFDMTLPLSSPRRSTDESTDAYDTIDWLVKNVPQSNGRVGVFGISYDGELAADRRDWRAPRTQSDQPAGPAGRPVDGRRLLPSGRVPIEHGPRVRLVDGSVFRQ